MNEQPGEPQDQIPRPAEEGAPATASAQGKAERELARLQQERDQLEDQLKRALADSQNIRRRQRLEMDEARRRTLEGLAQELLPVLDSFALALKSWEEGQEADPQTVLEGVRMVRSLLSGALERHGVQEIPAAGMAFDPNLHEAVAVEARPGVPAGQVLEVLQSGYQLGDRVIRPSRVRVSAEAPPKAED